MSVPFQAGAEVLAALDCEVREGIRVLPRRGLEIGGLLIGKAAQIVEISGARSVEIEHRFGPSFVLSDADVESFRTAIREAAAESEVIGHYRSQTKGEPESREADDRIADLLGISKPVLLIIPVDNGNPGPGRLYRRENGVWTEPGQSAAPVETVVTVVKPHRVAGKAAAARASPKWRLASLAAAVLIGAVIFHYAARQRPVAPPVSQSRIGLTVERGAGAIVVRWNATSPAIQQAASGVLFIEDGSAPREVALSRELLLEGKVFYAPQSPVAEFRLQVYRDRQHYVAEGVRIETGVAAANFSAVFDDEEAAGNEADRMAEHPNAPANGESRKTPRRILSLPTQALITASAAEYAPPPPEVGRMPAAVGALPEILGRLPTAAPPAVSYVAAVPLRRVNASIPPHLRSAIKASTAVEVKVSIDESGKVVSAIPVTAASFEAQLLAPQATQAARLWSFSPARRNGQPQSSELLLTFTFDRGAAQ